MTDNYINQLASREMLSAQLETCQELVARLEAQLGHFEGERVVSTNERPYIITVEVYRSDYKRVFDMVCNALPDGLDVLVSGKFETEERKDNDN